MLIPLRFVQCFARLCVAGAFICLCFLQSLPAQTASHGNLRVTANGRYLEYADGTPFFYLGDTAWNLFFKANKEEADLYLTNRAAKGFTVIQAVVLAPDGGIGLPNANGDLPLIDRNPARPNEAYFRHVDAIVDKAASLGLFIGMLPSWGENWKQLGKTPSPFTPENARSFARFLGRRYKDKPIIWILGGDQDISSQEDRAVVDAFAAGLHEGDGGAHLISYHPRGPGLSSDSLADAKWLDFYMNQSSHGSHDHDNGLFIERDYSLSPAKPTLDGEPRYECMPVGFYFANSNRQDRFDDYDVRQAAYWALLAGACGHTYGNNNIWQMWQPGRTPLLWANMSWQASLDTPGAFQMGHARRLFEARPFTKLVPSQKLLADAPRDGGAKVRAAIANDASFAFFYSPRGEPFTVDKTVFKAPRLREIWFDPRYGCMYLVHSTWTHGYQTFTPPTSGRGQDWILIIEDEAKDFPLLGAPMVIEK
jgi:hypothetical protein